MIRRLFLLTQKELLQLSRDAVLLIFVAYAFTGDVYMAGSGVTLQLYRAPVVAYDGDHSQASRGLLQRLRMPYFRYLGELRRPQDAYQQLEDGTAMVSLSIPEHFERDMARGRTVHLQLLVDTSNSLEGQLAAGYVERIVEGYCRERGAHAHAFGPRVEQRLRLWFNPNGEDGWFMGLMELLANVTLFAILLPGAAMAREKERGTIEQLIVCPLSVAEIMAPKALAMGLVILLGTTVALFAVLGAIFHIPMRGSLTLFFAVTVLHIATTAALGLLAATLARNLVQMGMLTVLLYVPILFLSGVWTPPEAMPSWMQTITHLSPLHYYVEAAFGILFRGETAWQLRESIGGLSLLGLVLGALGLTQFRRQFD